MFSLPVVSNIANLDSNCLNIVMGEAIGEYVKGDWSQLPGSEVTRRQLGFAARHALMNVIEHVLASSDRTVAFVGEDPNADDKWARADVEAEPPFETVEEAAEAGIMISLLWQDVSCRLFAPEAIDHIDTFVSRGSKNPLDDQEALEEIIGEPPTDAAPADVFVNRLRQRFAANVKVEEPDSGGECG